MAASPADKRALKIIAAQRVNVDNHDRTETKGLPPERIKSLLEQKLATPNGASRATTSDGRAARRLVPTDLGWNSIR